MKPINVGLLGIGTVGAGTFSVLARNAEEIFRRAGRPIRITQVADKDLLHANWPELDAAVAAATRREIGDRWAWGRRGEGDISMLEAATVALWAQDNARTRSAVDQRLAEGRPAVMSV